MHYTYLYCRDCECSLVPAHMRQSKANTPDILYAGSFAPWGASSPLMRCLSMLYSLTLISSDEDSLEVQCAVVTDVLHCV